MPVTTVSAAVHITPGKSRSSGEETKLTCDGCALVAVKTFFKHYKIKGLKLVRGESGKTATDDIFFDE
jgi:hypothetical protein